MTAFAGLRTSLFRHGHRSSLVCWGGSFIDNPDFPELNKTLGELAEREKVSKAAIAIAWVLRHPAKMQAIIGSMNPEHIKDACVAADVTLSHHA